MFDLATGTLKVFTRGQGGQVYGTRGKKKLEALSLGEKAPFQEGTLRIGGVESLGKKMGPRKVNWSQRRKTEEKKFI